MQVFQIRAGIMRYIYITTISLILASCGASQEDKNIAAVTCSIMAETRNMDAAVRVEKMNDARKEIGGEPFLGGDSVIQEAFEYGLCQDLVLNENYEEMIRKADSKPSIKEEFHENGQLKARVNYQSKNDGGKWDGLMETYYENGQLAGKGNYKDGKLDGLSEIYRENGKLWKKVNYKDGEQEGLAESYYENGQLEGKANFKDGKLDGLSEIYYENGQFLMKINYKDGKNDGLLETNNENGSFVFDMCYKNGEVTDKSYCKPQ